MVNASKAAMGALAAIALAVPVLSGCGSDGNGEVAATTEAESAAAPSKADYIVTADVACRKAAPQLAKLSRRLNADLGRLVDSPAGSQLSAAALEAANSIGALVTARSRLTSQLKRMEPPQGNAAVAYVRVREKADAALRGQAKAFRAFGSETTVANGEAATEAGKRAAEASKENTRVAARYGFKVCGAPLR